MADINKRCSILFMNVQEAAAQCYAVQDMPLRHFLCSIKLRHVVAIFRRRSIKLSAVEECDASKDAVGFSGPAQNK